MSFRLKRFEFCLYIALILLYAISLCFHNRDISNLLYKLLFVIQVISFALHALATEAMRNSIMRTFLTFSGGLIAIGALFLLSRTVRIWHTFRFETFIILVMGTWQFLYTTLTFIEMKRLKAKAQFFNDDFTKNIEKEEEEDDDENWVNKKFW